MCVSASTDSAEGAATEVESEAARAAAAAAGISVQHTNRHTGLPCEMWPTGYFHRMQRVAAAFERDYAGQAVLCFSHAASLALAAALLRCPIAEVGRFAPCGILVLRRPAAADGEGDGEGDAQWVLEQEATSNAHVERNSPTTYPWTFSDEMQAFWAHHILQHASR